MLPELIAHPYWFWLTLGGLLLAAEMLGTGGYLLWSGVAAVVTGVIGWMFPLAWQSQGLLFAVLTLACVLIWYRVMRHRGRNQPASTLNQRGAQMVGLQLTLETPLVNGFGHVRIGDSSWRVAAADDLPAGTQVVVVGVEGITLRIEPRR